MRLESRLGTRAKIKSVLESIGVDVRPCFQQLFDTHIAKDYNWSFLDSNPRATASR
jgi:hypothetical protein